MIITKTKVLLLNGERVQTVCFAKGLRSLGCVVSALCESKLSSGYCTRWLNRRFIAPSILTGYDSFKSFFYEHITNNEYDVIIPMADESAHFLSNEKEMIEKQYNTKCAIPTYSQFIKASDKQNLMDLCRTLNVDHPRTYEISQQNIQEAIDYVGLPALIKPNVSAGAKGITKVLSAEDISKKLPSLISQYGPCTLQQFIMQPDYYYNVMLYRDKKGIITGQTVIKIRRYFPLRGGTSCYSETVENPQIVKQCVEVLEALDWNGFADFDVLKDIQSDKYMIIEINPRVPSSLQASFAANINFPECYLCDLFGGKVSSKSYKSGQQVRWLGLDVMWFLMSPQRFSFTPSWFNFFGKNISYHDGAINDPLPILAGCLEGVKKYLNPQFRKSKLQK